MAWSAGDRVIAMELTGRGRVGRPKICAGTEARSTTCDARVHTAHSGGIARDCGYAGRREFGDPMTGRDELRWINV